MTPGVSRFRRINLHGVVTLVVVLAIWDLAARRDLFGVGREFFPPAGDVLHAWWRMTASGELPLAVLVTLRGYAQGFAISAVIGVAFGVLMARSRIVSAVFSPLVEFLRPMPSVAVIPLAIAFFGIGDEMKRFVATYGALWPVLLNTYYGIRSADARLSEVAQIFRLGEVRTLLLITLPAASPFIMTGLRIGSILTLGLIITAELIASGDGVGNVIQSEQLAFKVPETFAGVVTVALLGVLVNGLFVGVERRLMRWHLRMTKVTAG